MMVFTAAIANYKGILPCFLLGVMTLFSSMLNAYQFASGILRQITHLQTTLRGSIRIRKQLHILLLSPTSFAS
jgi:hypothetical protein